MLKASTHTTFHKRNFQIEHEASIRGGFPPRDSHFEIYPLPECVETKTNNELPHGVVETIERKPSLLTL